MLGKCCSHTKVKSLMSEFGQANAARLCEMLHQRASSGNLNRDTLQSIDIKMQIKNGAGFFLWVCFRISLLELLQQNATDWVA